MKKLRQIIREELLKEAPDYETAAYQMDKWLPNDMDVIEEFQQLEDAQDVKGMAAFLESEASDEVGEYGITTSRHFKNLAKHILG